MNLVNFLGGVALGAASAALYDSLRGKNLGAEMGQGVVTGGFGGGPGGGSFGGPSVVAFAGPAADPSGGGPSVVVGPAPGGGGDGAFVVGPMDDGEEGGQVGPIISVDHIIHNGGGFSGSSFFGISAAPWFYPLNFLPWARRPRPLSLVCKKAEVDDEEVLVCEQAYPTRPVAPVAYAWGPPAGWL